MSRIAVNDTELELIDLWRDIDHSRQAHLLRLFALTAQRCLNAANKTPQAQTTTCKIIPFKPRATN